MAEADSSIASLRSRLAGLAQMLGGEPELAVGISVSSPRAKGRPAAAAQPPAAARAVKSPPARQAHFQPTVRPAVLRAANTRASDAPLGGLLQKYRDAEAAWLKVWRGSGGRRRGRRQEGRRQACCQDMARQHPGPTSAEDKPNKLPPRPPACRRRAA